MLKCMFPYNWVQIELVQEHIWEESMIYQLVIDTSVREHLVQIQVVELQIQLVHLGLQELEHWQHSTTGQMDNGNGIVIQQVDNLQLIPMIIG